MTDQPDYTVDYFMDKFEVTQDDEWCTKRFTHLDKFCALGHCGQRNGNDTFAPDIRTDESRALAKIFECHGMYVTIVNDGVWTDLDEGFDIYKNKIGLTRDMSPRQRILKALRWIKEQQEIKT